jgi:very-short-patch-repair endonuclease
VLVSPPLGGGVPLRRWGEVVNKDYMKPEHNKKFLKPYRKELRNNSTSAEAELWNHLKNKQLNGYKFRRQHSINNYIVDFFCPAESLIIELDGDSHGDYHSIEKDEKRDRDLNSLGYKVLRFENRFIFQDIDWVKEEILKVIT